MGALDRIVSTSAGPTKTAAQEGDTSPGAGASPVGAGVIDAPADAPEKRGRIEEGRADRGDDASRSRQAEAIEARREPKREARSEADEGRPQAPPERVSHRDAERPQPARLPPVSAETTPRGEGGRRGLGRVFNPLPRDDARPRSDRSVGSLEEGEARARRPAMKEEPRERVVRERVIERTVVERLLTPIVQPPTSTPATIPSLVRDPAPSEPRRAMPPVAPPPEASSPRAPRSAGAEDRAPRAPIAEPKEPRIAREPAHAPDRTRVDSTGEGRRRTDDRSARDATAARRDPAPRDEPRKKGTRIDAPTRAPEPSRPRPTASLSAAPPNRAITPAVARPPPSRRAADGAVDSREHVAPRPPAAPRVQISIGRVEVRGKTTAPTVQRLSLGGPRAHQIDPGLPFGPVDGGRI